MCFSAEASFIAGAVLTTAGIASIKKTTTKSQIAFASIPLIFGAHQFIEGFVWLSFQYPAYMRWRQEFIYLFLIFAQIIWPTWVSFSIMLLEKNKTRKRIFYILIVIGILFSSSLAMDLITQNVSAKASDHHILYDLGFPASNIHYLGIFYVILTIIPPFISSIKKMWTLGILCLGSFLVSRIFFNDYIISVWCFFAAIISIVVYSVITNQHENSEDERLTGLEKSGVNT